MGAEVSESLIMNLAVIAEALRNGKESVTFRPHGNSMTPIIKSGQEVTVHRLDPDEPVGAGDVVLVKVQGRTYLHLITAIQGGRYQIGNNHGRINGWTSRDRIYGVYCRADNCTCGVKE